MLRVADAQAGREFMRRLTPHVDSAAVINGPATEALNVYQVQVVGGSIRIQA